MKRIPFSGTAKFIRAAALVLFLGSAAQGRAQEFTDGRIKLVLHERSGRFSLYYMTDTVNSRYQPLFGDQDPRTSFLTVMVNDRTYKLGESSAFKIRLRGDGPNPALVFESPFLTVTEEFVFIRPEDSEPAGGISIVISAENKSNQASRIGMRFLLDTNLGEAGRAHFESGKGPVSGEVQFTGGSGAWWRSANTDCSVAGGLYGEDGIADEVLISNWKRLNDAAWKISVLEGRNFNLLPYSVNDSAVAYYFEPASVAAGAYRGGRIWLLGGGGEESAQVPDAQRFASQPSASRENSQDTRSGLAALESLISEIDSYIASGNISEEELAALERSLEQLRARYNGQ